MMFGFGESWPVWQLIVMEFGMVLFWGLIIWAVYVFASGARREKGDGLEGEGLHQLLDRRLAKGEINPEQYSQTRDLIDHDSLRKLGFGLGS